MMLPALAAMMGAELVTAGCREVLFHPKVPDVPMYLASDGFSVTPVENVLEVACRLAPEWADRLRTAFEQAMSQRRG